MLKFYCSIGLISKGSPPLKDHPSRTVHDVFKVAKLSLGHGDQAVMHDALRFRVWRKACSESMFTVGLMYAQVVAGLLGVLHWRR